MSTELTWQLVDPWTRSGWLILGGGAALLTLLTLWTYWGVRDAGRGRVATVLALRLVALLIAFLLLTRPGLAVRDTTPVPSKLIVFFDASRSMTILDGGDSQSRWEASRRLWRGDDVQKTLDWLQKERQVEVIYYQGADDIGKLNLDGEPKGERTLMALWLRRLREEHHRDDNLRGLILFSDGVDNGGRDAARQEAGHLRDLKCPIYTYRVGKTTTSPNDRDVAVVSVDARPSPGGIKAPLAISARIDERGFNSPSVVVKVFVEVGGKEKQVLVEETKKPIYLERKRNDLKLGTIYPDRVGEHKITVKVEPLPNEANVLNNEMSTYVNITKEGISVLWVEARPRAWEPAFALNFALLRDPRFRVTYTEPPPDGFDAATDWYQFKQREEKGQLYDVIVIGDISAQQFTGGKPGTVNAAVADQVARLVQDRGVGLVMLGGHQTFGGDWRDPACKSLTDLLPVELPADGGRIPGPAKLTPTPDGQGAFLLRVSDRPSRKFWDEAMDPLEGMVKLGKKRDRATVYATGPNDEPLLVGRTIEGRGQVLAFGGDTTWQAWRRTPEAVAAHARFWKQMILWLARQEEAPGQLWIKLETRRVQAGGQNRVNFQAGIVAKGNEEARDVELFAQLLGPDRKPVGVRKRLTADKKVHRGFTPEIDRPGEYTIEFTGTAKDRDGKLVKETAQARFMAYPAQDIEMATWAAEDELLEQLAERSGGRVLNGEDRLVALLRTLGEQAEGAHERVERWPEWGQKPLSDAAPDQLRALWGSGALACVVVFLLLICTEWVLRRRWGLV
jgi:uncharacterized membrane protein